MKDERSGAGFAKSHFQEVSDVGLRCPVGPIRPVGAAALDVEDADDGPPLKHAFAPPL